MKFVGQVSPQMFFEELMSSRAARSGAVIRRKVRDVEGFIGRDVFLKEMSRRGFQVFENAGQFVVFCNREDVRRLL